MRAIIALCLIVVLTGGLQGDLASQTENPQTVVISVDSTNLRFSPSSATITEGDTVRFFWSGQALPHNAGESNGVFDSGEPAREVDYSFTFERGMAGTYEFVCEPHASAGMVGQITVEPAPALVVDEPQEVEEENTPALSLFSTVGVLTMAWVATSRRHGNG